MEADKAPNLNPQFTNNVGSIEVIVLRCKSDTDTPPPRVLQHKQEDKPTAAKSTKRSAAAPAAPSAKATSVQDDMLGGLFGIFDGACDSMEVFDLTGKKVRNANLADGLYIVKATKGNDEMTVKVIVK